MTLLNQDQFLRIKDLANFPKRPERTYTYKDGKLKGTVKRIGARQASKGMIGVSDKTIWQWVKQGEFPAPIKLGNITVWKLSEVQAWMQSKGLEA
ncbi:helix-turn-helix transcriptional regulator [Acinetobacter populi]|uniref:AlpA family transcriptional regulator n=1 Tax=Acinetobacter populi TaxID=1582270 RepID=A0A1Z9Z3M3_9GAMM|nr:AlpA family phage regulatory protein [Acinetobacter populi]OUY09022.1 AlpA family transcriptional regulator [Acinetobacter populi]